MNIMQAFARGHHYIAQGQYIAYVPIVMSTSLIHDWKSGETIINNQELLTSKRWRIASPQQELNLRNILKMANYPGYHSDEKREKELQQLILETVINIDNHQVAIDDYLNTIKQSIDILLDVINKVKSLEGETTAQELAEIDCILAIKILDSLDMDNES